MATLLRVSTATLLVGLLWPGAVLASQTAKAAAAAAARTGKRASSFTARDLGRVTAVGGAASFVGSVILYQLSQASLARLDGRLAHQNSDGRIIGISYDKAGEELGLINRQRLGAAVLGMVGLAAMGFGAGVLAGSSPPSVGLIHEPLVAPSPAGVQVGWAVRW